MIARYCKLFGLSPAEELAKEPANMAINWTCFVAYCVAENELSEQAKDGKNKKQEQQAHAMAKFLDELKEQSTSRG